MSGFNNKRYLKLQSKSISNRFDEFDLGRLYLEVGGKFLYDGHAARVLTGYDPRNKVNIFQSLGSEYDIIFCIDAGDIESNRSWSNTGETYEETCLSRLSEYQKLGLPKPFISLNKFKGEKNAILFAEKLQDLGYVVAKRYFIDNYFTDIKHTASSDGFGKDEYIDVNKDIVVVTSIGSDSGKLSTCLGQVYLDTLAGKESGYAKFETFPIWNLPLNHPINIAYEAATVDIGDFNQIDPFHKKAYNIDSVNYNRDIEAFPIIQQLIEKIISKSNYMNSYKSPTDMGINMTGFSIDNDQELIESAKEEIIRRYIWNKELFDEGSISLEVLNASNKIMTSLGLEENDYELVSLARANNTIAIRVNGELTLKTIDEVLGELNHYEEAIMHSPFKIPNEIELKLEEVHALLTQDIINH